ncbi:hypothetical protein FACS1894219_01050 [Clostridia bacterium]|nr:hypothetical protein FACS1894219_01050 [Clostridia bacterium]
MKRILSALLLMTTIIITTSCAEANAIAEIAADYGLTSFAPVSSSDTYSPETTAVPTDVYDSAVKITLGEKVSVDGTGVYVEGNVVSILAEGNYAVYGQYTGQIVVSVKKKTVSLILCGADITNPTGPAIYIENAKTANIILADGTQNTLEDGSVYADDTQKAALFSNDTLTVSGGGFLTVYGNYKHGIASDDDLTVSGGNINIYAVKDGIHTNDLLTISGGNIEIAAQSDAFDSESDLLITGGVITVITSDNVIYSDETIPEETQS